MKIVFATGNDRKLAEAQAACEPFGIEVSKKSLPIDEIQSNDPMEITTHKVNEAFRLAGEPIVVTDTNWSIPGLNGFPGGYMKDVANWFSPEDFLSLMANKEDRRVSFTETIMYTDGKSTKVFSKQFWGVFADKPAGTGNSIEVVAQFDGQTIGEKRDLGKLSHDPEDYVWHDFAKWLSSSTT